MFCFAVFKLLTAVSSACAFFSLAFASICSSRAFASCICAEILSSYALIVALGPSCVFVVAMSCCPFDPWVGVMSPALQRRFDPRTLLGAQRGAEDRTAVALELS